MMNFNESRFQDSILLLARVLFMLLFLVAGWDKVSNYAGTIAYFTKIGVPFPTLATILAIIMEVPVGIAIIVGFQTRPLAILLVLYTIATAFLGHPYWHLVDAAARLNLKYHFYKNFSIAAGFCLLYLIGAGKYSVDAALKR